MHSESPLRHFSKEFAQKILLGRDKNSGGIVAHAAWNVFAADQKVLERRTTTAAQSRPQQPIEVEDQSRELKQSASLFDEQERQPWERLGDLAGL